MAFSCKERGTCPSCAGRTMANCAAHLVDRVLPNVPIRQWVLSLPFDLRALAARHPALVSAIDRILFHQVERWMQRSTGRAGPNKGRAGSVTFVQRFGGSLNLHVHFHVLFLEGIFTRSEDAPPVFHPALAPTRADLVEALERVRVAVVRWVEARGLSRARADSSAEDDREDDALDACASTAVQPGLFDNLESRSKSGANRANPDPDEPRRVGRESVALDGFNLHASVRVGADDDVSRERLVRYCARPPFALERLSVLPDGRIAYRVKQPRKTGTHRILTPVELLARIAALIPPPRHPFLRYHGVIAPSSKWRSAIVARAPDGECPPHADAAKASRTCAPPRGAPPQPSAPPLAGPSGQPPGPPLATKSTNAPPLPPTKSASPAPSRAPFAVLSAAHRARLAPGDLLARSPRLEWSKLLRRTFADDVLVCPRCSGRARIVAAVQDPIEAARLLAALRIASDPISSRARGNDDDDTRWTDVDDEDSQVPPSSRRATQLPLPDD